MHAHCYLLVDLQSPLGLSAHLLHLSLSMPLSLYLVLFCEFMSRYLILKVQKGFKASLLYPVCGWHMMGRLWCMDISKWTTYRVVSYPIVQFFLCKIHVPAASMSCPCRTHAISVHHSGALTYGRVSMFCYFHLCISSICWLQIDVLCYMHFSFVWLSPSLLALKYIMFVCFLHSLRFLMVWKGWSPSKVFTISQSCLTFWLISLWTSEEVAKTIGLVIFIFFMIFSPGRCFQECLKQILQFL